MNKLFRWVIPAVLGLVLMFTVAPTTHAQQATGVKVNVQWALQNPRDWDVVDSSVWSSQPTKSDPIGDVSIEGLAIGDSLLNNVKGYIFALNVQGIVFNWYDHYAVESLPGSAGVVVTVWRDNPILFPEGWKQAEVWTILNLAFDPRVGQNNTVQSFVLYAQPDIYDVWQSRGLPENGELRTWDEFVAPSTTITKPGVYVSDTKWTQHLDAQTLRGWRD